MKAIDISGQAPGGPRTRLGDALPLDTPFVVQIFPAYACNFKCRYCIFSVEKAKRGFISDAVFMDFGLFRKCIDEMADFPRRIKVLRFVGIGEPLLHQRLAEMIAYAVQRGVANTVELLTNASLLTHGTSDALIAAGLSRLVVSVQGASDEQYRAMSRVDIHFDRFIENLRYFSAHKGGTHVYIKIVDTALQSTDDERRFHEVFGDLCDTIAVEHTVPIHAGIDYKGVLKGTGEPLTQFGLPVSEVRICPQPFFHLQINPDGKVVPCYSFEYPAIMGDCNRRSVPEIWNGREFRRFRRAMLEGARTLGAVCATCTISKYRQFPEDMLNDAAERLKSSYEEMVGDG